ncbi:hypothetical protein [Sphingobacterium sp. GVS05A]|uniref:hypothetical protein n=1 Tax=Sphingobacterium sp. GVS05A TaxID=2862679 RepID=UPI001CBD0425|nr:hypothetical protein [Sphingobacterium sp. GVS05A]
MVHHVDETEFNGLPQMGYIAERLNILKSYTTKTHDNVRHCFPTHLFRLPNLASDWKDVNQYRKRKSDARPSSV